MGSVVWEGVPIIPMPSTERVRILYTACSKQDGDVVYDGVAKHTFSRDAIERHKADIEAQVATLNAEMDMACPWLRLCLDRDNNQWGDHPDMERLTALGVASGAMREVYRESPIHRVLALPTSPLVVD